MRLADFDYGARTNPRSTGDRDLAFVELRPTGEVVCRTDGQRLVVDLKRSVGMGTVSNTALGPSTIEAIRAAWGGAGSPVPAELIPKASWRNGERIPDELLRTMLWWTYGRGEGLTRDQVLYDGAADQLRYGEARGGTISPNVRCVPVRRRAVGATGSSGTGNTGTGTGNTGNTGTGTGNTGNTGTGNTGTGNTGTGNTGTGNTGTGNTGTGNTGNTGTGNTGNTGNTGGDTGSDATMRTLGRVALGVGVAGLVGVVVTWWSNRDAVEAREVELRRALEAPRAPRAPRVSAPPSEPPAGLVGPAAGSSGGSSTRRGFRTMRGML